MFNSCNRQSTNLVYDLLINPLILVYQEENIGQPEE